MNARFVRYWPCVQVVERGDNSDLGRVIDALRASNRFACRACLEVDEPVGGRSLSFRTAGEPADSSRPALAACWRG
jgi:hypothetical protein